MSTQVASQLESSVRRSHRSYVVGALGPLTALAGVLWALAQPYRLTIFHPAGQGFWSLAAEGPLLVVLVGVFFHLVVAPGLREDLGQAELEEPA
jgi:hypothetical protein